MEKLNMEKEPIEQEPRCQKCHGRMYESTTYFFPKNGIVRRIDVPYSTCTTDRTAKLDLEKLRRQNPKITITDEIIDDIKKYFGEELYLRLQK